MEKLNCVTVSQEENKTILKVYFDNGESHFVELPHESSRQGVVESLLGLTESMLNVGMIEPPPLRPMFTTVSGFLGGVDQSRFIDTVMKHTFIPKNHVDFLLSKRKELSDRDFIHECLRRRALRLTVGVGHTKEHYALWFADSNIDRVFNLIIGEMNHGH